MWVYKYTTGFCNGVLFCPRGFLSLAKNKVLTQSELHLVRFGFTVRVCMLCTHCLPDVYDTQCEARIMFSFKTGAADMLHLDVLGTTFLCSTIFVIMLVGLFCFIFPTMSKF